MDSIKDILNNKKKSSKIKPPKFRWQEVALKVIEDFKVDKTKKSSVFKACKDDVNMATRVSAYCLEGDKNTIEYFFKMYNIWKNQT